MPPTPEGSVATRLRAALGRLPVVIDDVHCEVGAVPVAAYEGGTRPTSLVELKGHGATGYGEHVGWTPEAHEAFAFRATGVPRGRWSMEDWAATMATGLREPYDRAALEAAAIDLALHQQRTNAFELLGLPPPPVRYVVSYGRCADPVAVVEPDVELKLDVDLGWSDATWAGLAARGGVAVLDFKLTGTRDDHERAHRALPAAWLEDPRPVDGWSATLRDRLSVDGPMVSPEALATLPVRPGAVNLKPARMGGVLSLLDAAVLCAEDGTAVYMGGMWEVSFGRRQLCTLAALLAPDGANDIAPHDGRGGRPRHLTCDPARPGL